MIQYRWDLTGAGNPYVRLRNSAGDEVSIIRLTRKDGHKFYRVFSDHRVVRKTRAQPKDDFGNLAEAWRHARRVLTEGR